MKNIKTSMVKISRVFLLLIFVLTAFNSFAKQIPTVTGIMKTTSYATSPVVVGNPTATNIIFVNALANAADYNIKNTVSLKYDLNTDTFFLNPTTLKVKVLVKIYNAGGTQIGSTTTKSLTIIINNKLNQPILEQSSLKLTNGYKVEVTIADIWLNGVQAVTLPKWASVESEINMDRYYDFSLASNTGITMNGITELDDDCDAIKDEIRVDWQMAVSSFAPEEYQLEWAYVNSYAATTGNYAATTYSIDFKNNSTRITTLNNSYKISLLFDKGYIGFRVRAVGRDWLNPTKFVFGPWSAPDFIQISSLGTNAFYTVLVDHEKDKNWQYATTYAEEGKKKEVINYFDGSLHNRQTVTKINSDNNVIVGETMYDFQGRPAINVLPVPVNFPVCTLAIAPAIRYYPKFNVNSSGMPYSKIDFDEDGGSCLSNTSIMDSISGASQYYSNNNPNKSKQQAFLPHAQKFPFTQVEYTPDNTGRIRNQSGVGKNYQLGTGKETKYLYGQPNQLQVDRLFGSETGDASHYKKNVVIDANGQSSVTYLNQEGKTIATALAGIPPTETGGTNTRLDSLPYANANQAKFTIDLFNKNASGKSLLNVVPPSNDQIVFSSQLLVTFRSLYEFQYTLNIDTVHDACLRNGICFNCVYDLEIQVKDECGIPVTSAANIKKNVGKFSLDANNNLVFSTSCGAGPSLYNNVEAFNIILQPGVYTVSKILKVNKEAKDFYVKAYLDSLNNSCYKSLSQFQAAELAKIDTMDCYVSCASCAADLGKQDDYVASGRGTAEQWLFLIDKCNEPCRRQTLCEVTYDMMLSDVSPGGQYGKFNSTTFDASSEPLSVFNVSNALRSRITAGGGTWRKPYIRLGGFLYPMYLDEDGVRKRVNLTLVSPGIYSPQVLNTSLVYTDPVTGVLYTFPENLKNLADFISEWDPNFAKSLVLYHPEYAYYLSCSDHNIKYPGSNSTTNQIDSLMETCSSFAQALAPLGVGFIKAGAIGSTAQAQNKMRDLVNSTTGLNDPFFSNSLFQYSVTPNPVTGAKTNVKMDAIPFFFNIQNEMNYIVNNYKFIGSIPYTMADVAAIVTRCGNNFSTTPTAACMAFGNDFYPSTYPNFAALNDSIRNQEWRLYKQFYLAEKQKLQFKRMDFYARYLNDGNSNFYGGCNACIGNSGFDPFATKMILPPPFPYNTYPYSPFFDGSQPCHYGSFADYGAVTKRFYDPANTGLNPSSAAVQLYNMTGQCPITFDLQNFLNSIAKSGTLTTNNVSLNTIPEFGPDLYVAVSGGIAPATFINYKWQVSTSGNILTANFVDPSTSNTACVLTIDKSNIPSVSFSNFIGINQLVYDAIGPPTGTFKAVVVYTTSPTTTLSANITGNTTCINLKNCVFDQVCTPNQLATDVSKLFSALQVAGQLSSTSPVSLNSDTTLKKFLTPTIKTNVNATVYTNLVYKLVPPNQYMIYESTGTTSLVLTVTNENPPGCISASSSFANIKSNYNNNFKMDAKNAVYAKIGEVEGKAERWETSPTTQTINLSMGDCGIPELPECATNEHKVRKDIELLVKEILTSKPVNSGSANLFVYASFSPLLKSYVPNTLTSTSGNYIIKATASPNYDTLKINIPGTTSTCIFTIYHYRNDGSIQNFSNVTNVSDLQGIGVPDLAGNYSYFRAIATYVYGTNTYKDTIFGHSCWPIKNCDPCPLNSNPAGTARSMSQINSSLITDHNAFLIPAIPAYNSYRAAVDSVNAQNGWGPLDSNYVQKMSYKDFTLRGFFNSENYIKFIQNFDPAVDSRIMLEPDSFVYYYGNLTNCNQEYDRYVRAIAKYNIRASAVSGATILAAIKDSIFYHNHLCDTSFAYLKYLRGYPTAGPNPDDILQFFNITNPNPIYLDSCKVEYDYYIKAHHDFTNDALAQSNCKNANILHPLYSYDAIVNNNLCGSSIGLNVFKSYVGSLKTASVTCPSPLPSLTAKTSAASYAPVLPLCHTYYIAFINAINSYNSSTYASVHSHSLNPNIYPTFYSFYKSGYCDCVLDYINYLNAYTSAPGSAIFVPVLPVDIDNYGGCPHSTPVLPDSCDMVVYGAYYFAVINYNQYIYDNFGQDSSMLMAQIPYLDFVAAGYCKCGSKFAAGLNSIVSGSLSPADALALLDIENVCGEKPCTRPMDSAFVFPPYVKYDNPCVQQQINLALQNAANAFQQYQDSLTTYFADKYTRHCLNAFEDFNYKYVDKEYHFTLYYYDQAGNLIKTVPPEGVKPINITSYGDTKALQINYDRTFDQQNVFTDHTMQTNYVYNSLNQLIYQSLPDHDKMDICDGVNPNGLDTGLVINTVQFVTPNKGYLCGYVKNSQIKRGYVYTSDDAGGTWRKLTGITAANMQKVQFVNANIGYAVSDFGMLFKTLDGGNTWDVMIGLYNPTSGARQVGMLSTLCFTNTTDGIVGGTKNGGTFFTYSTMDGGNTFNNVTVAVPVTNGDSITSIVHDGTSYLATSRNGTRGWLYTKTGTGSWARITSYNVNNLKKVQYIASGVAYAVGEEGTLLRSNGSNTTWTLVPTGFSGNINDVYFKNTNEGVALIDSVPGKALLYKTSDGGLTWQLFGDHGEFYRSLEIHDAANDKLIAVGQKGLNYALISRVLLNTTPFGIAKVKQYIGAPQPGLDYGDAVDVGSTGKIIAITTNSILAGVSSPLYQMFTTYNAQDLYPTWTPISLPSWGFNASHAAHATIKKALVSYCGTVSSPSIQVLMLTTTGRLYGFWQGGSGGASVGNAVLPSYVFPTGTYFEDITSNNQSTGTIFYALDKGNNQIYALSFPNPLSPAATVTVLTNSSTNPLTGSSTLKSIDISNNSQQIMAVGDNGRITFCNNVPPPPIPATIPASSGLIWTDPTQTIPTAFTDVKATPGVTGDFIVTGIDGSVWKNSSTTNLFAPWVLKNTGTAEKLNAVDINASGTGFIVGNNGKLLKVTGGNTSSPSFATITPPVSANLTDIALDPFVTTAPIPALISASNGDVLRNSDYTTGSVFTSIANFAPSSMNGVCYKSANIGVAVGNNNLITTLYGPNNVITKNINTRGLYSIHFTDPNNGFVIDSNYVIRRTTDGGNNWSVVVPTNGNNKLNRIYTTKTNQAIAIGNNKYIGIINGNTIAQILPTSIPIATGTDFYDINFAPGNTYGVIVGSNTRVLNITPATATTYNTAFIGQPVTSTPFPDFRTVHVFNDKSFIAAGTRGEIYYRDFTSGFFYQQSNYPSIYGVVKNTITIKDIYFRDNYSGYFVGDKGQIFKVKLLAAIQTLTTSSNNINWQTLCTAPVNLGYVSNAQITSLDFNSIAFSSPTNAMLAGANGNVTISGINPIRYARILKEQSALYSTRFWYDKLGRLIVSQNTKQYNKVDPANGALHAFSYTLYDGLGRIVEVGEKYENTTATTFTTVFGSLVGGYTNSNAIDSLKFINWISGNGIRREVTKTYYDNVLPSLPFTQNNLRKRVASTTYVDVYNGVSTNYNHGTHYTYDIHGNVSTLWQENKKVGVTGQEIKQIDYQYDLISGKVNKVTYSPGQVDQFIHKYTYDADNRITKVETSKDDVTYGIDAKYFYYAHGPLARVEYGKDHVQGVDYAYTLQGWIKGINSNILKPSNDMGNDGDGVITNPNGSFARDVMAYSLNYYNGDYAPVDYNKWYTGSVPSVTKWEADKTASSLMAGRNDLFNGNISAMVTTISKPDSTSAGVVKDPIALPMGNAYRYDQLNRIKRSSSVDNISVSTNSWTTNSTIAGLYRNTFTYDANGNIGTQVKRDSLGNIIDSLDYRYENSGGKNIRNRLYHVDDDFVSNSANTNDIDDQGTYSGTNPNATNNYRYDEIGNLYHDTKEGIDSIRWNVYGKIKAVRSSTKDNLYFDYDASGNRIAKHVYSSTGVWKYSNYYERDAQGNVLSVYDKRTISSTMSYKLDEQHLYGSGRLGMTNPNFEMIGAVINNDSSKTYLGLKYYELSNHLGNVLTVISDKKIQIANTSNPLLTDHYVSSLVSTTDYYPFGQEIYGRRFRQPYYRLGFNGKEKDDEVKGSGNSYDYGARIYDVRLGKFMSIDPLTSKFPFYSPYQFAGNKPIAAVDLDGEEESMRFIWINNKGETQIKTIPWNKIMPGQEHGSKGTGSLDYTKDPKTGKWSEAKYVKSFDDAHPVRSGLLKAEGRYQDKKGFKALGNDIKDGGKALGKASTYVKGAGIILVLAGAISVQPEIIAAGVATYNAGGKMEDISNVIELGENIANKDAAGFIKNAATAGTGKVVSDAIKKTGLDDGSKAVVDYVSGKGVEAVAPKDEEKKQ